MNTNNTKQSKTTNGNQSQPMQGFTWNWGITISEKVLLALLAVISTFITGFAIGNSQGAMPKSRESSPQSAIAPPPLAVEKPGGS